MITSLDSYYVVYSILLRAISVFFSSPPRRESSTASSRDMLLTRRHFGSAFSRLNLRYSFSTLNSDH
jgi:hypothetical protein